MNFLWTAFALGLFGSLHCAGMCGPLALAVPVLGTSRTQILASRLLYNAGRIASYGLIGVVFGTVGKTVSLAGAQQWLSLGAGIILLAGFFVFTRCSNSNGIATLVMRLKRNFGLLLPKKTPASILSLGLLNGFLPCGLVYVAATAAISAGTLPGAVSYMAAFGFGTLPMMLGIGLAGPQLLSIFQWRPRKLIPIAVISIGSLLVLRGLALDIPYLSPNLHGTGVCHACH